MTRIYMQPDLDHAKLAHGFRFLLVLEVFCIPSIITVMTLGIGALAASMVWKTPLF